MNSLKLKEAMNQVHMKEDMQEEIIMNVKALTRRRQHRLKIMKKAALTAAAFALMFGAAIPIQAGIRYLVKDRMENIPKKELEEMNQMLQMQEEVQADGFSREYTREENIRLKQLEEAYQNGKFPKQTIAQKNSSGQVREDSLSYDADTGIFYLPDRTLTDEELLQIIDFQYTGDYALAQGTTAQQAREAGALEENRLKAAVKEAGGITRQQALQASEAYLKTEFGLSGEGMESDIFLDEQPDGGLVYHISYKTQDDTFFYAYGIDLSAGDGSLVDASYASLPIDRTLPDGEPDRHN